VVDVVSKQSSEAERNAMEAERAMDDYYKVLYISDYVGEVFEGVISGVTPFGIFVELENGVEGLVKIETLKGRFELDQKNFRLKSAEVTYRLGQPLKICVAGVDLTSRRAEFIIFNDNACKKNKKRVS
jgi:ribonuclease R